MNQSIYIQFWGRLDKWNWLMAENYKSLTAMSGRNIIQIQATSIEVFVWVKLMNGREFERKMLKIILSFTPQFPI